MWGALYGTPMVDDVGSGRPLVGIRVGWSAGTLSRCMSESIPFNRPCLAGREMEYMHEAVMSGHSSSGGPYTVKAEDTLRQWHGAEQVLLTTSCTDALEMSGMLLGIGPGDTVIVPSFTFTSTALAYARAGARLRFCDIDPVTLGLDPERVREAIDDNVKAIVTVHYAGVPSSIDELVAVAAEYDVALIEDNAHGLFATHQGRPLGSFGRMSTLSFHETKNFTCGEGGAIVLNDARDIDAAHILLDKGTNRRQFLDGAVDKYTWQGVGSSFGLSDLLAAFLVGQLEEADAIQRARRRVSETYRELLEPFVDELGLRLPFEPEDATPADHMFYVVLAAADHRAGIITEMRRSDVHPTFHYVPLHSAPAGREFAAGDTDCPVTDDISSRLLRLPFYNDLTPEQIERVVTAFVDAARRLQR